MEPSNNASIAIVHSVVFSEVEYVYRESNLIDQDMFCFDQFKWNDKLIQVFERFAEPEGVLYYKTFSM